MIKSTLSQFVPNNFSLINESEKKWRLSNTCTEALEVDAILTVCLALKKKKT